MKFNWDFLLEFAIKVPPYLLVFSQALLMNQTQNQEKEHDPFFRSEKRENQEKLEVTEIRRKRCWRKREFNSQWLLRCKTWKNLKMPLWFSDMGILLMINIKRSFQCRWGLMECRLLNWRVSKRRGSRDSKIEISECLAMKGGDTWSNYGPKFLWLFSIESWVMSQPWNLSFCECLTDKICCVSSQNEVLRKC